tara:strand:+ start:432 stop:683 length:252 start_codon:yes stop_codon:yes gene_type:complete
VQMHLAIMQEEMVELVYKMIIAQVLMFITLVVVEEVVETAVEYQAVVQEGEAMERLGQTQGNQQQEAVPIQVVAAVVLGQLPR